MKSPLALFVFLPLVFASPVEFDDKKPFTLDETVLGGLPIQSFSGNWISDTEIEYLDKQTKDVKVLNVPKNETRVILKSSVLNKYNTTKYTFSGNRKFVLLCYDEQAVFRHSKKARYAVYSIQEGTYYDVSNKEHVEMAEWGPKGNTLLFIKNNNIYLILNISPKMESAQITTTGNPGSVYNGMGDWVYEEEILSSGRAFWFSPNGEYLAFATFSEKNVKKVLVPEYGEPADLKNQYVGHTEIPYPKAGSTNPTFELRVLALSDLKNVTVVAESKKGSEILHSLKWHQTSYFFFYYVSNRVQNESSLVMFSMPALKNLEILVDKNPKGWASTAMLTTRTDFSLILMLYPVQVEKLGKFKHIMMLNLSGQAEQKTSGAYDVLAISHWDESKRIIYYAASEEYNATTTQIYAVGEAKGSKPVCLTCRIKSPEGRGCKDASAKFSKNSTYVMITCNGPDPRMVYLFKNEQPLGKPLAILEGNAILRAALAKKVLPEVMNLNVEVPGATKADVRLFLPPKMDKSGKTKYPMIIYVYGGPNSKNIADGFKIDLGYYFSTNLSVIYGLIDGRNTIKKGEDFLFAGYRALGTVEMEDQINVTRTLQKKYPFIDASRTGIWGWSYGGYATTKILELDTQNVFKYGIAVAPVADWMYYDSMYTERYMGLPQENTKGYERSSVLKDVSNLRNKKYFLIHGNADDNVHYQNAMMIAKALERNNIPFELMSYPDEDHSLSNVKPHLYSTMDKFWKKCFNI